MSRRKSQPVQLRQCIRCGIHFDPAARDVLDWPVIDEMDASDHCRSCWIELAKTLGRPLGRPDLRR